MGLYQAGSLDLLPLNTDQIKQISQPDDPQHSDLVTGTSMCTSMLQFKPGIAPTDDINVRKALILAIDKTALLARMNLEPTSLATDILPPAMPGFQDRKSARFDPQAAVDALKTSKYAGKMPPIKMIVAGSAEFASKSPYLLFLVDSWQKVLGIKVEMEYVDPATSVALERSSLDNIVSTGWCADYPDPQNFLDILYHSSSEFNVGQVNDPDLDTLLEHARTEPDIQKRLALYQQAEDQIMNQAYTLLTIYPESGALVKPRVKGFILSPIHASFIPWLTLDAGSGQ